MKHPRTLKDFRNHPYVSEVSVETDSGDGYWIYLKEPYFCDSMELPSIHEYSIKECSMRFDDVVVNQDWWSHNK